MKTRDRSGGIPVMVELHLRHDRLFISGRVALAARPMFSRPSDLCR